MEPRLSIDMDHTTLRWVVPLGGFSTRLLTAKQQIRPNRPISSDDGEFWSLLWVTDHCPITYDELPMLTRYFQIRSFWAIDNNKVQTNGKIYEMAMAVTTSTA
jgi:hypothetical protein